MNELVFEGYLWVQIDLLLTPATKIWATKREQDLWVRKLQITCSSRNKWAINFIPYPLFLNVCVKSKTSHGCHSAWRYNITDQVYIQRLLLTRWRHVAVSIRYNPEKDVFLIVETMKSSAAESFAEVENFFSFFFALIFISKHFHLTSLTQMTLALPPLVTSFQARSVLISQLKGKKMFCCFLFFFFPLCSISDKIASVATF